MVDRQQPPIAEELFTLVTTLHAEIQQLCDNQNGTRRAHGNDNGGGGDSDHNDDDGTNGSDNEGDNNTTQTVRTKIHVSNTASARSGRCRKRSISSFQELADLVTNHFAASPIYQHDSDYLSTIKQGQHESLRDYVTRFTKIAMEIQTSAGRPPSRSQEWTPTWEISRSHCSQQTEDLGQVQREGPRTNGKRRSSSSSANKKNRPQQKG
ncbi:hypothetical protein PIB30_060765 [Stylosanthes scabra]|uniref:Retrotransposon gag domain-containing protein n=1 Tax=Stylosanthes scabra TaxID=79078 RepID=A0ABU6XJM0_9FABA|nr:hypothetical protein [Stylosanthes scabra]